MSSNEHGTGPQDPGSESGILALSDFAAPGGVRVLRELRAYWTMLRAGRAVPDRADIDPRAIERTLEYAFILERIAAGHARFRIAGMHLNDLMGMEVRGMTLASFFAPEARGQVTSLLEQVFNGPEIAELELNSSAAFGRVALPGRMLLMPLRSDLGDISRILGCLVAPGQIGRTPRRFTIERAAVEAVISGAPTGPRILPPEATQPSLTPPSLTPARTPAPDGQKIRPPGDDTPEARRARFRVVD